MTPSANSHLRAGGHNVLYLPLFKVPWDCAPGYAPSPFSQKRGSSLSLVESIAIDLPRRKSFVPHTYEKHRGGGHPSIRSSRHRNWLRLATQVFAGRSVLTPAAHCTLPIFGCKIPSGPSKALETSPLFVVSNQMSGLTLPVVLTDPGFQVCTYKL